MPAGTFSHNTTYTSRDAALKWDPRGRFLSLYPHRNHLHRSHLGNTKCPSHRSLRCTKDTPVHFHSNKHATFPQTTTQGSRGSGRRQGSPTHADCQVQPQALRFVWRGRRERMLRGEMGEGRQHAKEQTVTSEHRRRTRKTWKDIFVAKGQEISSVLVSQGEDFTYLDGHRVIRDVGQEDGQAGLRGLYRGL